MKKIGVMLLATMILVSATACSNNDTQNQSNSITLYKKGVEMTMQMDLLAESKDFTDLFTVSDEISKNAIDIGDQDYSKPKAVYEIVGLEDSALQSLLRESGIKVDSEIQDIIKGRFGIAVASQINAQNGAEFLATTSILTVEDSFLYNELDEQKTYLYLYDGKYNSMVTFIPFEDNIVATSANIVMEESFTGFATADDVTSFFEETMGFKGLTVSPVKE
ncbi:hypothetical protein [Anaerovorax sp. IOR16]|uniref:hypothetical protein n=1 Tax=Anaerovorax sp. IOR16 TaxID=2773458 RepID=UPI0019D23743|nr:hypothetical protein [Anaerovorax sp. IOR16]